MIRLLLVISMLMIFPTSKGQSVVEKVNEAIDRLQAKQVDTFLVYTRFCVGCSYRDTCETKPSKYLFWRQSGQTFLRKFSYCKAYHEIWVERDDPLIFFYSNQHIIDTEEIKPPTYYEIVKQRGKSDTLIMSQYVDHSVFQDFLFIANEKKREITVDMFNLEKEILDNKRNIYYEYNNSTKTKELIDLAQKHCQQFDEHNKLE